MKALSLSTTLSVLAASSFVLQMLPTTEARLGFHESLDNHNNFIVANGWGPERWGCAFTRTQVHETGSGTIITIGKDSALKPFSCGELIYRESGLGYGFYSIDMIASNVVGQVTSFFLIANEDTEIDIELTGLNNKVGWMNIWHNHKQNPVAIDLPFDASQGWHTYAFEWRQDYIAWSIDGNVILNRSDIATTPPNLANYKLAINSWTQVQPELNIEWAGKFVYPTDGKIPQARFRNMKFRPATATRSSLENGQRAALGDVAGKKGRLSKENRTKVFEDDGEEVDDGSEGGPGQKQVKAPEPAMPAKEPEMPAKKQRNAATNVVVEGKNGALFGLVFAVAAAVALL
ncbi:hypothetical protein BGZ83_005158 [Gryganskiella cystojenkinii]|nr:hypothetical protein BGZ83_005158 [Gryganskiella cystojenkinii]